MHQLLFSTDKYWGKLGKCLKCRPLQGLVNGKRYVTVETSSRKQGGFAMGKLDALKTKTDRLLRINSVVRKCAQGKSKAAFLFSVLGVY